MGRQKVEQPKTQTVHESSERGLSRVSNTRGSDAAISPIQQISVDKKPEKQEKKENQSSVVTERPMAVERISPKASQSKQSLSVAPVKKAINSPKVP